MVKIDPFNLLAIITCIFPMLYFGIATPSFFFRKFSEPPVTWMLRGLLNVYFWTVGVCCTLAALVFTANGRPHIAVVFGLIVALSIAARFLFLRQVDTQVLARDAGDTGAVPRLRRLHLIGMAYNLVQIATIIAILPADLATTV